jgi:Ner family transcriptional regulator
MKTINTRQNNPSESWEWIKYRLSLNGFTFGKLAILHNVKKQNFTNVKKAPSPKYERIIANHIGLQPWDLWPQRYDPANNPNRVSSRYQGHKAFLKQGSTESNKNISGESTE